MTLKGRGYEPIDRHGEPNAWLREYADVVKKAVEECEGEGVIFAPVPPEGAESFARAKAAAINKGAFKRSGHDKMVSKLVEAYHIMFKASGEPISKYGEPNAWLKHEMTKEEQVAAAVEQALVQAEKEGVCFIAPQPLFEAKVASEEDAEMAEVPEPSDASAPAEAQEAKEAEMPALAAEVPQPLLLASDLGGIVIDRTAYEQLPRVKRVQQIVQFYLQHSILNGNQPIDAVIEQHEWLRDGDDELETAIEMARDDFGVKFI